MFQTIHLCLTKYSIPKYTSRETKTQCSTVKNNKNAQRAHQKNKVLCQFLKINVGELNMAFLTGKYRLFCNMVNIYFTGLTSLGTDRKPYHRKDGQSTEKSDKLGSNPFRD